MAENEKLSILRMIESGRLTADEGLRLLEALDGPKREPGARGGREANRVRIMVTELGSGRRRAQANLPMALVDLALRLAARNADNSLNIAGQRLDLAAVLEAMHSGTLGRILDVVDDRENVKVEVFLE